MQSGVILSQQDIKKIIAEHFHVSEDKVIASKYSFYCGTRAGQINTKRSRLATTGVNPRFFIF